MIDLDPKKDAGPVITEAIKRLAERQTATPDGVYLGGGVLRLPAGVFRSSMPISLTPQLASGHHAGHITLTGQGRLATVLIFDNGIDGLVGADFHGINADCQTRITDLGVYGHGKQGVRFLGGGSCVVDRVLVSGFEELIAFDCQDTSRIRDCSLYEGGIGVAMRNDTNGAVVEGCQFNGPAICISHEGGVGQIVRDCNSESGVLARVRSGQNLIHENWLHETRGEVPAFHFDDQGSPNIVPTAIGFTIRGGFIGGTKIVRVDPKAAVYHFAWDDASASGALGAVVDNAGYLAGQTTVIGRKPPVPMFARELDELHDLDELGTAAYVPNNPRGNAPVLPAKARPGALAFAWHGRKQGEGPGQGTGVPVYFSGVWRVVGTDLPVAT